MAKPLMVSEQKKREVSGARSAVAGPYTICSAIISIGSLATSFAGAGLGRVTKGIAKADSAGAALHHSAPAMVGKRRSRRP